MHALTHPITADVNAEARAMTVEAADVACLVRSLGPIKDALGIEQARS